MSLPMYTLKVLNRNYARPNRYWVQIAPPIALQKDPTTVFLKDIELNCQTAQFPSLALSTAEIRTKGPLRKMPYDQIYDDLNVSFYNGSDFRERRFFEKWMSAIVDPETKNFEYYENYTTYIVVAQLDVNGLVTHAVQLEEAYPINLGEIALSYESTDTIETFPVTFTYRSWKQINSTDPLGIFKQVLAQGIQRFF